MNDRQDVLRDLKRMARKLEKANAMAAECELERLALYQRARAAGLTFKAIAAVFGITEAAVMAKLRREDERLGLREKKAKQLAS